MKRNPISITTSTSGSETFIPIRGGSKYRSGVKRIWSGDIFHIQPYSFQAVEDESYMMCLFQGFDMINTVNLHGSDPYTIEDEKHRALYNKLCHKMTARARSDRSGAREFSPRRQGRAFSHTATPESTCI